MLKIVFKIGLSLVFVCALAGCASVYTELQQKLPPHSKIGVQSLYGDQADFKHAGITIFSNESYKHSLPNLKLNEKVVEEASRTLRSMGYRPTAVTASPPKNLFTGGFSVTADGAQYFKQLREKSKVDYLLLIEPCAMSFTFSGKDTDALKVDGYGVFSRTVFGVGQVYAAAGYRLILVDLRLNVALCQNVDRSLQRIPSDTWKSKFQDLTNADKARIVSALEATVPKAIAKKMWILMGFSYS